MFKVVMLQLSNGLSCVIINAALTNPVHCEKGSVVWLQIQYNDKSSGMVSNQYRACQYKIAANRLGAVNA